MKMIISNCIMFGEPLSDMNKALGYINERLTAAGIKYKAEVVKSSIVITASSKGLLFESAKPNRIELKPGDSRIKEKGRNYLDSPRMSARQHAEVIKTFKDHLDSINLGCSILLTEFPDDPLSNIIIRDGMNSFDKWIKPKSFPKEV